MRILKLETQGDSSPGIPKMFSTPLITLVARDNVASTLLAVWRRQQEKIENVLKIFVMKRPRGSLKGAPESSLTFVSIRKIARNLAVREFQVPFLHLRRQKTPHQWHLNQRHRYLPHLLHRSKYHSIDHREKIHQ